MDGLGNLAGEVIDRPVEIGFQLGHIHDLADYFFHLAVTVELGDGELPGEDLVAAVERAETDFEGFARLDRRLRGGEAGCVDFDVFRSFAAGVFLQAQQGLVVFGVVVEVRDDEVAVALAAPAPVDVEIVVLVVAVQQEGVSGIFVGSFFG